MVKKEATVLIRKTERMKVRVSKVQTKMRFTPCRYQRPIDSLFAPFSKTYRPNPP